MKSVLELAKAIGYTPQGVRLAIKMGRLKAEKCGWAWVIEDNEYARVVKLFNQSKEVTK